MKALYELLAKVGTNPKLRAWAMEQIINLKKLKPNYKKDPTGKKSWDYKDDLDKVKDIKNPNWRREKIAKERAYDLKTKVVDIAKAKDKVRWNKVDKQRDKDAFYGVTGQAETWLNKMNKEHLAFEKQIVKDNAWFNKLMKAKVKHKDPRAIKILNDYFKKQKKDFADKIIPFKPKKADGGRIGLDEGGPSQKDIDKGIAAIEKLKSSLMPESYEELIEIYKDKQKDLNIDIMEDAGGLGEMLGEGGRIGMMYGGDPGFAFSYGGSWADWKDNHASEMPLMDYINQKLPKARNPFSDSSYQDGGPVMSAEEFAQSTFQKPYNQLTPAQQQLVDEFTSSKAEGGRIGMAKGDTPSEAYLRDLYYDGGWDAKGDIGLHEFMHGPIGANEWFKHNNKAEGGRIGFKKGGKGGIGDLMSEMYRLFEISPLLASPELMDLIQKVPFDKGGKVKKGGGPNMSRRSFLQLMGGLASLPVVGKYFKLGKPLKDITVKIKKSGWNEDVDYGTSGNILFDFVGKSKVGRELIKKYLPKNYKKDWGMDPKDAYKIVKKAKDKGLNIKVTEFADEASTTMKDGVLNPKWYLGGKTLDRQTQQRLYNQAQQRFKKQTPKENIKEHLEDTSFFSNDMYRWPKPNYGGTPTRYTDEIIDLIEPVVKKAEGGSVGYPPIQLGPLDLTPRASGGFSQGQPYGPNLRQKTWSDNIGIGGVLDLPGGFNLTGEYDKYRTKDRLYTADDEYLDKRVRDDHDRWKLGLQWKKKFAKGGKAWRPKSAPQLTTTIPPESGPMPQGLTYLTGDDIVQNIGHKHGRN